MAKKKNTDQPETKEQPKPTLSARLGSFITTYKKSSFAGYQFKSEFFETATACLKRLGSWTSKDLEFAAMLDRFMEVPTIIDVNIGASGSIDVSHGLAKAPRMVSVMGIDSEAIAADHISFLIAGWDDATIAVSGTPLLQLKIACYR